MKKYLVVAAILVALVALFSFSASAADISLDATAACTATATGATIDTIGINLSGAPTTTGYYTVLAFTGTDAEADPSEIVYAGQESAAITGFNLDPADLLNGGLYVKFGGTDLATATNTNATFKFALIALNAEQKAIAVNKYTEEGVAVTADGADSYIIFGAEVMDADGAAAAGLSVSTADETGEFMVRSFRTIVDVQ